MILPCIAQSMTSVSIGLYHQILNEFHPTRGGYSTATFDKDGLAVACQAFDANGRMIGYYVAKHLWDQRRDAHGLPNQHS